MKKMTWLLFASTLGLVHVAYGTAASWAAAGSGNWDDNTKWSPATFPNAIGDSASFLDTIGAPSTIGSGTSITVGNITFNNTAGREYTIQFTSPFTLTLDNGVPTANITLPITNTSSHDIDTPISIPTSLTVTNNSGLELQISKAITGSGSLIFSGNSGGGNLTLISANGYLGGTTINGGSLLIQSSGSLLTTGTVTINGGFLSLQMTAASLTIGDLVGTGGSISSGVELNSGKTLIFGTGANTAFNGLISPISGSASITKQGAGNFTFTGKLLGTLGTTINNGTFSLSGVGLMSSTGSVSVNSASSIFDISGLAPATSSTIGDLSGVSGSSIVLGTKKLIFGTATFSTTFDGVISGLAGSIEKRGSGTVVLSGANTYGSTTITAGTLSISSDGNLGTAGGGVLFNGGGTLQTTTNSFTTSRPISIVTNGTFEPKSVTTTLSGTITGDALTKIGSGTLALTNGGNNYTGLTTINAGTLSYAADGCILAGNSVTVGNGVATSTFSIDTTMTAPNAINVTVNTASTLIATSGTAAQFSTLLGTGTLNLGSGSSIVNITPAGADTFSGVITGGVASASSNPTTGSSLTKSNTGTLTLNNAATDFVARTFVANGILQVQNGSALGASGANSAVYVRATTPATLQVNGSITLAKTMFLNGAGFSGGGALHSTTGSNTLSGDITLGWTGTGEAAAPVTVQVDLGSTLTSTGVISGNQPLTKIGSGTLILTGANSYGGGTVITAGTLQGDTTGLQGNIANSATLVFDQTGTGTYAGAITGSGAIVKQGTGTVVLSGASNAPAAMVTVSAGSLVVNGSLSGAGPMTVASGALLGGNGTITKSITCSGTLAPGNSIDTINLIGPQILASGSTLAIELNPTTSDRVNVTGTMTIQPGATLSILPDPGDYSNPITYIVIQTSGGLSGTFTNVTSSLPLFTATVDYTLNDVLLEVTGRAFASLVNTGNAGQVARCLDGFTPATGSDLAFVISALRTASSQEALTDALLFMQPSQYTATSMMQENNTLYLNNGLFDHLESLVPRCQMLKKGIHLWAVPFTAHQIQKHQGQNRGYKATTPGVLLGVDSTITKNFILGGALGYSHSELKWTHHIGTAKEQAGYGTIYSRWGKTHWFLESSLMYGYSYYKTRRAIHIDLAMPIDRNAKGTHHGMQGSAHLKAAADWSYKKITFEPFAEADYIYIHEDSFKEKGAQSLDLNVSSKNSNLLMSEGGLRISRCSVSTRATITPYVQASGIYESRYIGKHVKALFNGCPLNARGMNPSRPMLGIEGGVNVTVNDQASIFSLFYKGRFAKSFMDNAGYFQASVKF